MAMLEQDRPALRRLSPRTWIRKTNYSDLGFAASFSAYENQRRDLLKVLRQLPDEGWLRGAIIKAGIKGREETVLSCAQRMAQHEAGHCEQIERILGSRPGAG